MWYNEVVEDNTVFIDSPLGGLINRPTIRNGVQNDKYSTER